MLREPRFEPLTMKFEGRYAENHLVDVKTLSQSLEGANLLIKRSCFVLDYFDIPSSRFRYPVQVMMLPPQRGSFIYEIAVILTDRALPFFVDVFARHGLEIMWRMLSLNLLENSNREREMDPHFKALLELTDKIREDRNISEERFVDLIKELALSSQSSAAKFVANVGNDTNKLILPHGANKTEIDIPSAEVIRSKGKLNAGDLTEYKCKVLAVKKPSHTISVAIEENPERQISGKVVDPAFDDRNNIYIRALDEEKSIEITAKPLSQDGEIKKLVVMDAREID